jgi:TonB dependent receptor
MNEARIGVNRATFAFESPWTARSQGTNILPSIGGTPYLLGLSTVTSPYSTSTSEDPQGRISPVYTFSDKFTWLCGKHSLKAGFQVNLGSENAFVSFDVVPRVTIGTGNTAIPTSFNTLFGNNATGATSLLNNLAGSVGTETQEYYSPGGKNPQFIAGSNLQHTWRHRDFGTYIQDDIKLRSNLTLNVGIRWDYFGIPYEADGRMETSVGGASAAFGVSGNSLAALFRVWRISIT